MIQIKVPRHRPLMEVQAVYKQLQHDKLFFFLAYTYKNKTYKILHIVCTSLSQKCLASVRRCKNPKKSSIFAAMESSFEGPITKSAFAWLTVTLSLVTIYFIHLYQTSSRKYKLALKIPGPRPLPLIGNAHLILTVKNKAGALFS